MEGNTPQMQEVFAFRSRGRQGKRLAGEFEATGIVPRVVEQMRAEDHDIPLSLFQPRE